MFRVGMIGGDFGQSFDRQEVRKKTQRCALVWRLLASSDPHADGPYKDTLSPLLMSHDTPWLRSLGRDWTVVTVVTMVPSGMMVRSTSTFLVGVSELRSDEGLWPPHDPSDSTYSSCVWDGFIRLWMMCIYHMWYVIQKEILYLCIFFTYFVLYKKHITNYIWYILYIVYIICT